MSQTARPAARETKSWYERTSACPRAGDCAVESLLDRYEDGQNSLFFSTSADGASFTHREKPLLDGAVPAGNSPAVDRLCLRQPCAERWGILVRWFGRRRVVRLCSRLRSRATCPVSRFSFRSTLSEPGTRRCYALRSLRASATKPRMYVAAAPVLFRCMRAGSFGKCSRR